MLSIAIAIAAGLIIGSFLNVCIVRLPADESIVAPRSHCRSCKEPLAWYDNVPLLGWAALRGRCRHCSAPISLRYPLVEAVTAGLFAVLVTHGFPARELFLYLALVSALIVITFIDFDHFIIPDAITLPSILVAPAFAFAVGHVSVTDSALGIVVGGGILWSVAALYERIRKQEGMGFGDVKLLAMIGGFQGWVGALFALLVAAVLGSVVGVAVITARRGRLDSAIPFGPFLTGGSLVYLLWGPELIDWYFGLR